MKKEMILTLVLSLFVVFVLLLLLEVLSDSLMKPFLTGPNPTHLIVLQHGWISPYLRSYPLLHGIGKFLKNRNMNNNTKDKGDFIIAANRSNSDLMFGLFRTNDGIDKGGIRLSESIEDLLREYPSVTKLSMIGSSLGGLYHRYAIAHLSSDHSTLFKQRRIQCMNYVSLASPHLGVADSVLKEGLIHGQSPNSSLCDIPICESSLSLKNKVKQQSIHECMMNPLIKNVLHQKMGLVPLTLAQLLKIDDEQLIHRMANEEAFVQSLKQFENVLCYANASHDRHVSFSSASIMRAVNKDGSFHSFLDNRAVCKVENAMDPRLFRHLSGITESIIDDDMIDHEFDSNLSSSLDKFSNARSVWFHRLQSEIPWQRYVCNLGGGKLTKMLTHQIVSGPLPGYRHSKPIFDHLLCHLKL